MRHAKISTLARLFTLVLAFGLYASASWALEIHLATDGNDGKNGVSKTAAVKTLKRAWELAQSTNSRDKTATIVVWPGVYAGQSLVVSLGAVARPVKIVGKQESGERPVFKGDGVEKTWLVVRAARGEPTGLEVEGLEVRDYLTAISLEGNREHMDKFNSGTVIRNNVFRHIGSIATGKGKPSTAVIRLVNSHGNRIENNQFENIRSDAACGGLHSIYMAHFSSENLVSNNRFEDICGSAIKLRDRSNSNTVENNQFKRLEGVPAVEEWFCDKQARKDCTKVSGECPSTGTVLRGNRLSDSDAPAQMLSVIGGTKPLPWCAPEDFSAPRTNSADGL